MTKAEAAKETTTKETIKMTNVQAENILSTRVLHTFLDRDLPTQTGYYLAKILDTLESMIRPYLKIKQKKIEKYADRDANGKLLKTPEGGYTIGDGIAYRNELESIQDEVIDLGIEPVVFDFKALREMGIEMLPTGELRVLMPLIDPINIESDDKAKK